MCHLKQRNILCEKLGHVDVHQCPEQQHALVLLRVLQLQIPCCRQHRLHSSHTIVIVVLGGQLLGAQTVGGHNLLGQTVNKI